MTQVLENAPTLDQSSTPLSDAETDGPRAAPPANRAAPQRTGMWAPMLGMAIVFFIVGGAVAEFRCFPYAQFFEPPFVAARALYARYVLTSSLRDTDLWHTPRYEQRGVVLHQPDKAFAGYTLYTSGHDTAAFLIDMDGRLVHRWRLPFHRAWSRPPHVERPSPESFIHWRRGHVYPNGDLIALYEGAGDTPWGYGLVKVDRMSNVIWKVAEHIHHDLCVRADDSIVTLAHDWRDSHAHPVAGAPHLGRLLLEDFVLVLSPAGEVQQKIPLADAIAESEYASLLAPVLENEWDLLHTNTVEPVTPEFASRHEFARPGQIMLSFRTRHALAILDLESERIVWASCGPYRAQHDPDVLPNGRILLFDNRGRLGPGAPSRIIELDPVSQTIHWSYAGSPDDPLNSTVRSVQQLLPNGNLLITESDGGRILEVTRAGEVVWEFHNPASLPDGPPSVAITCGATRLPTDSIDFEFNAGNVSEYATQELKP